MLQSLCTYRVIEVGWVAKEEIGKEFVCTSLRISFLAFPEKQQLERLEISDD